MIDHEQVFDLSLGVDCRTPLHGSEHADSRDEQPHETDDDKLTAALSLAAFGDDRPLLTIENLVRLSVVFDDAGLEEGLLGADS